MRNPPHQSQTYPKIIGERRIWIDLQLQERILIACATITGTICIVYWNSFQVPFIFDDTFGIVQNSTIRSLWTSLLPPHGGSGVDGRPMVNLSLALNYAIGGMDVRGYHLLNLFIHACAALALFGIVRRTLLRPQAGAWPNQAALNVAFGTALLWAVHPLQTESVTCIIQRTESLGGLAYLSALYFFVRGSDPSGASTRRWLAASVLMCLVGMATKEIMATFPLIAILYDRTFGAGSFRTSFQKHRIVYGAMIATWMLLAFFMIGTGGRGGTVGLGRGVGPWTSLLTQSEAVTMYLKLVFWPSPLVLDYGIVFVKTLKAVLPQTLFLCTLVVGTGYALWRKPPLGFVGAWFFIILAPSSSIVPLLSQTMAEHRMYLPLAAAVLITVITLRRLLQTWSLPVYLCLAIGASWMTISRNNEYKSALSIWSDTVAKCPDNARAQTTLGTLLAEIPGRLPEAISHYETALRIKPDYEKAHYDLGNALAQTPGETARAIAHYETALILRPDHAEAHNNLANVLSGIPERIQEAVPHYQAALQFKPSYFESHYNLAEIFVKIPGRLPDAIAHYEAALLLQPDDAETHHRIGCALFKTPGRLADAIAHFETALRLRPDFVETRCNLGLAYASSPGRFADGIVQLENAVRLKPEYAKAHIYLGSLLLRVPEQRPEAIKHLESALRIDPNDADAQNNLGLVLLDEPNRLAEAIAHFQAAVRIHPQDARPHHNLGLALLKIPERKLDAVAEFETALRLNPGFELPQKMLRQLGSSR